MAVFPQSLLSPCLGWAGVELGKGHNSSGKFPSTPSCNPPFHTLYALFHKTPLGGSGDTPTAPAALFVGASYKTLHWYSLGPTLGPQSFPFAFIWLWEVNCVWAHRRADECTIHNWTSSGSNCLLALLSTNIWDLLQSDFVVDKKRHSDSADECPGKLFPGHHQGIAL